MNRRANPHPGSAPTRFGYSAAGVVLAAGQGAGAFNRGMRVACMGGGYASHASRIVVPKNMVLPLPENLSFAEGSFACLAATALQAVRRAEIEFGHNVLVMGLGIVGQLACQEARASGAHVMGIDRIPMRVRLAKRFGTDSAINGAKEDPVEVARKFTRGAGMDAAIIAFGGEGAKAVQQCLETMKTAPDTHRMGVISIVGGLNFNASFPTAFGNIDVRASSRPGPGYHDKAWEFGRDYPPVFVRWTTLRNMEECLRFASEGRLKFSHLISRRIPLDAAPGVIEGMLEKPGNILGLILEP